MRRIIGDFDPILTQLIDQRTLIAFADKYGFPLSKRLIDAEIAQIPRTKGLNGQFSEQAYQAFPRAAAADRSAGAADHHRRTCCSGCC